MDPLTELVAASLAFLGTHFAMSHPLRAPLAKALGTNGFTIAYSLVAFATFGWMILAFRAAPAADLGGATGEAGWIASTLLTLPALVLFLGSFRGNPAMPAPGAEQAARAEPRGVFRVTRHPMMWGFALWALAHIILWWSWRTVIFAGAILILALVGAHLQDHKKQALMGDVWYQWELKTHLVPRIGKFRFVPLSLWLVAIVAWLGATHGHIGAAGVPAGIWYWI